MKHLTHRDQIHNDVFFDPISVALLNTPQMQRLGRIYQLGFAHLVYRGGTHTRLSHVMGVSHMAGIIVNNLKSNYENLQREETQRAGIILPENFLPCAANFEKSKHIIERWKILELLVRWGALLHDIGHIPLGHTLEDEYSGIYEKHDNFTSPRINFLWNENQFGEASDINKIFLNSEYPDFFEKVGLKPKNVWETVLSICLYKPNVEADSSSFSKLYQKTIDTIQGSFFHQYMADIVADTICADYLDYLQRDTQNVGLDTVKDLRILQSYYIGEDLTTKNYRMALSLLDRSGKPKLSVTTTAKNLVRHRYDLAEVIYYHKTKVSASAMLAKVFSIVDKPNEIRKTRKIKLDINNVEEYLNKILNEKEHKILDFILGLKTESLLEPILGDETMLFWILQEIISKIDKIVKQGEKEILRKYLTAIALLEGIIERRLYKNIILINADLVGQFVGTKEEATIEPIIQDLLKRYRNSSSSMDNRNLLEDKMQNASKFPYGSFITYVPGRKVQAKGIETGAFDSNGKVITLGEHSSVNDEVKLLNKSYQKLWKFLVFVHPSYMHDYIKLSESVDILLLELFPTISLRSLSKEIKSACRFPYISKQYREAVEQSKQLNRGEFESNDMQIFELAKSSCTATMNSEKISYRYKLIQMTSIEFVKAKFGDVGNSLTKAVNKEKEDLVFSESKKGIPDVEDIIVCLNRISKEFYKK
jgi:HD superfamily phosphohydrolase